MRAAWFLLAATGVLPAKFLQVGTPARPLFGKANVREVQLESSDWENIRDLALPTMTQLRGEPTSSLSGARDAVTWEDISNVVDYPEVPEENFKT
jgi:hypothetical protein